MTPDAEFPSYPSTCCLITKKRAHSCLAVKIELELLSYKAAETPHIYQTTTTINSLWEVKNAWDGDSSHC